MRLARNWQNLVRPGLSVTADVDVRRYSPAFRFVHRHLMSELLFCRINLRLAFIFRQIVRYLREKRVYRVIVPKTVEFLLMYTAAARRLVT